MKINCLGSDYFGSYLRLRPSAIRLVLSWTFAYTCTHLSYNIIGYIHSYSPGISNFLGQLLHRRERVWSTLVYIAIL